MPLILPEHEILNVQQVRCDRCLNGVMRIAPEGFWTCGFLDLRVL